MSEGLTDRVGFLIFGIGGLFAFMIGMAGPQQVERPCNLENVVRVMERVAPFLEHSDDMLFSKPIQRSIPDRLRDKADRLQRQDEAVEAFREMLKSCRGMEGK